ncbi:hypothetical protein V6N11_033368 [Hibiscus sabdariffa]|uniref:Uncharacterized protein n=1 Tax=Hibiscus sabdariffa TaxID=183260 RepID=A0ABR2PXW3_9ROSI
MRLGHGYTVITVKASRVSYSNPNWLPHVFMNPSIPSVPKILEHNEKDINRVNMKQGSCFLKPSKGGWCMVVNESFRHTRKEESIVGGVVVHECM